MTREWALADAKDRLIANFETLENSAANYERFEQLVWLIGWCESHPDATRMEYQQEVARVQREGPVWPAVRVIEEQDQAVAA